MTAPTGPAPLNAIAGTLRVADGSLHFTQCGSTEGKPLQDGTGGDASATITELGPDNGVTALVQLDGTRLIALHYAAPEGAPCAELPPAGDVQGHGQEPFWSVTVNGESATVRTPEELDGVAYSGGVWSHHDASHWRYAAARGTDSLMLDLSLERCVDAMSGARFPLKAILTRNGTAMPGCALQGRGS